MKKNDIICINITDMTFEGLGIGRSEEGIVVFVHGALKGETVNVKILKVLKNVAYGKIEEILKSSENRCNPLCDIFPKCGGCTYMHTDYRGELEIKKKNVQNALSSIAKTDIKVNDTLGGNEYNYRNKMLLPLLKDNDGKIKPGFYRKNSHQIMPMTECFISHKDFKLITEIIINFCQDYNIEPYNEQTQKGIIRHIYIRRGYHSGEIMAGVVTKTENLPHKEDFVNALLKAPLNIVSIIQNVNTKNTNVILGDKTNILHGKPYITDSMLGNKFNISCPAFYQVNTPMAEKLYEEAISYINEKDDTVFDLYCGAGTITLALSKKAKTVYGIENCEPAVENAIENAKENNIKNVQFICGNAEEKIFELTDKGIIPDAVVLDPPRAGCHADLIEALLKAKPKKIIYISCNPSTMARDINLLKSDYTLKNVRPVDLFPKTHHVECVVQLCRTTHSSI